MALHCYYTFPVYWQFKVLSNTKRRPAHQEQFGVQFLKIVLGAALEQMQLATFRHCSYGDVFIPIARKKTAVACLRFFMLTSKEHSETSYCVILD